MPETPVTTIPGIGKIFAKDFARIGLYFVDDFESKIAEEVYQELVEANLKENHETSKNYLYVIRMIIYYAQGGRDPVKLKWNAWVD
jgi:Pathogenicity locus